MSFQIFPVEVLATILDEVSSAGDLRSLRAASRDLHGLATPLAFRRLVATHSARSARRLAWLVQARIIARHVTEVVYEHREECSEGHRCSDDVLRELRSTFSLLHLLPRLSSIRLLFSAHVECSPLLSPMQDSDTEMSIPEDTGERSSAPGVQAAIIEGLSRTSLPLSDRLRSLSIDGLFNIPDTLFSRPSFRTLLEKLTHLHVAVTPASTSHDIADFWNLSIRDHILAPPASSLQSLSLRSDQTVGLNPKFSFDGLTYPGLHSLSLECFQFNPEVGVEDFIVRHKKTLAQLWLKDCTIALDDDASHDPLHNARGYRNGGRVWSRVWARLADELRELKALEVHEIRGWQGKPLRYSWLQDGYFWNYCDLALDDDTAGLQRLHGLLERTP
ncbi:hypothetical protein FA95DRAFT_245172 [Auriscalpium vulgare]|uniref:Uncharacterized protein n=1 Tax=Auriscalpium vulgare TaxID=40419 RepID=A0ACB8RLU3_9AGAM|nr:hypothetical protein FA95DRAFT_245172 [Auriscalpium vulgare]